MSDPGVTADMRLLPVTSVFDPSETSARRFRYRNALLRLIPAEGGAPRRAQAGSAAPNLLKPACAAHGYNSHGLSVSQGLRRLSGNVYTIAEISGKPSTARSQIPKSQRHFRWVGELSKSQSGRDHVRRSDEHLVILSFGFPAMPWFFDARWGRRVGSVQDLPWSSYYVFPMLFWVACGACGQGAIAIFVLGPIWIVRHCLRLLRRRSLTTNSRANLRKTGRRWG
jgi:hypothetical protein